MGAHAVATAVIINSYFKILDALEYLSDDQLKNCDTRREAKNIANKMQELEFVFMLHYFNGTLKNVS